MVRLPDTDRDGVRTMKNGTAVNQEAVDAAIEDWRAHQLKIEAETRLWRRIVFLLAICGLLVGAALVVGVFVLNAAVRASKSRTEIDKALQEVSDGR